MLVTIMALSLFCHIWKLQNTHILVECGYVTKFVGGIVHLAQIPKNVVHMFAEYPLTPLSHCH